MLEGLVTFSMLQGFVTISLVEFGNIYSIEYVTKLYLKKMLKVYLFTSDTVRWTLLYWSWFES